MSNPLFKASFFLEFSFETLKEKNMVLLGPNKINAIFSWIILSSIFGFAILLLVLFYSSNVLREICCTYTFGSKYTQAKHIQK